MARRDMLHLGERTVTVKREQLLETLRSNLQKHQKEYQEALDGYKDLAREKLVRLREKAGRDLEENFDKIAGRIERFDPEEGMSDTVVLLQSLTFTLKVPEDHSDSYKVAISMAEWDVNETVELTQTQFQSFVLDDWDWQDEFKSVSAQYRKKL